MIERASATAACGHGNVTFGACVISSSDTAISFARSNALNTRRPNFGSLLRSARDLHDAADATFDAICSVLRPGALPIDVIEASSVIEDAGFTIIDDLVHGFGGGYLPPILGCKSRPAGPVPSEPFRAGQIVVVQPNIITRDEKAGVQMGELLLVTESGVEPMHHYPQGFELIDA